MKTGKLNVVQLIGAILCIVSIFLPTIAFRMPLVRTEIMSFNLIDLFPFSSALYLVFLVALIALLAAFLGNRALCLISGALILVTGILFCAMQGTLMISRDFDWLLQQGQGVLSMLLQATGYSLEALTPEQISLFKESLRMLQHVEIGAYIYLLSGVLCCVAAFLVTPAVNQGYTPRKGDGGTNSIF